MSETMKLINNVKIQKMNFKHPVNIQLTVNNKVIKPFRIDKYIDIND